MLLIANFQAGQTRRVSKRTDALLTKLNIAPNDCRRPLIASVEFVNETLSESISDKRDYLIYKSEKDEALCFMDHPFLLTTSTKNNLLFLDNRLRMYQELRESLSFFSPSPEPYLKLHVTRERLVEDALIAVSSQWLRNFCSCVGPGVDITCLSLAFRKIKELLFVCLNVCTRKLV